MENNKHLWLYRTQFFAEGEMFQTKVVGEIKTYFVFSNYFFPRKSCCLWNNVGKYTRNGEATDDNMVQALFMLGT
jgi:hypothetical protein